MTATNIVIEAAIGLIVAEVGPWSGWLAARLMPWAARLRYGDTDRAAVRCKEWTGQLDNIPDRLCKLIYAVGHLGAGSAVSVMRKIRRALARARPPRPSEDPQRHREIPTLAQLVSYMGPERDQAISEVVRERAAGIEPDDEPQREQERLIWASENIDHWEKVQIVACMRVFLRQYLLSKQAS